MNVSGVAEYYVEDSADLLLMVMTPSAQTVRSELVRFLAKKREDKEIEDFYAGTCFGRYDIVIDIRSSNVRKVFSCAHTIQDQILREHPQAWLSLVCCHRLTKHPPRSGWVDYSSHTQYPIRTYSFFRMSEANVGHMLNLLEQTKIRRRGFLCGELYWNRSTYSYVLRTDAQSFDAVVGWIYAFRRHGDFLKDFCTFVTLRFSEIDKPSSTPIKAQINLKVYEQKIIHRIIRQFPNAVFRLGHFDLIVNEEGDTLKELFNVIAKIRRILRQSKHPNRTATVLLFGEPEEIPVVWGTI